LNLLAAFAIASALSFGPDGYLLQHPLLDAGAKARLPVEALVETSAGLWLVFHREDELTPALYLPPRKAGLVVTRLIAGRSFQRILPGLEVPRLFLYAPTYVREGRLAPPQTLAVDSAGHLYRALTEAHFDRLLSVPPLRAELEARSAELYPEVPADRRLAAYAGALSDFGAHLLGVANEIARSEARRRHQGRESLCRGLAEPRGFFGHWREIFERGIYRGYYELEGSEAAETPPLAAADKHWVAAHLFSGVWSGEPERDFIHLCEGRPRL